MMSNYLLRPNLEMMQFEYDPVKSQTNKAKHGVDFEEAQLLWSDVYRVELQAQSLAEQRFMIIGKHWSAIATRRDKMIRIISVLGLG
jgi:uncharacterized protein